MPKPSSGIKRGGTKSVNISQAKTIAEANALAVSLGLAQHADFTGLEVDKANEAIRSLAEHKADFPNLPQIEFVGSQQELNKFYGARYRYEANTIAFFAYSKSGRVKGIAINEKYPYPPEKKRESVAKRWNPVGCTTLKSSIDHEMVHWIDYATGEKISSDASIVRLYRLHHQRDSKYNTQKGADGVRVYAGRMATALSQYADTNPSEFVAEAWAEYRNNPSPRPLAKAVGDRIVEIYRERF